MLNVCFMFSHMQPAALFSCLVLLQPLFANGARRYSPEVPMVVVADVCGNMRFTYFSRSVFDKIHKDYLNAIITFET